MISGKATHGAGVCPYCEKTNLDYHDSEVEGEMYFYYFECPDCGAVGKEWYNLKYCESSFEIDEDIAGAIVDKFCSSIMYSVRYKGEDYSIIEDSNCNAGSVETSIFDEAGNVPDVQTRKALLDIFDNYQKKKEGHV